MTLGDLIAALAGVDPATEIRFDDGMMPTTFSSWRGIYAELALGYEVDQGGRCPAGALLSAAQKCDGKTFEGWKGGDYTMSRSTPLWRDNPGDYTATGILKLSAPVNGSALLVTADLSDYR